MTRPSGGDAHTTLGLEALAVLSDSIRLAIVSHLVAAGPSTATECADVVGSSPSNCSWHLRALANVGLVEALPDWEGDRRMRPWRVTVSHCTCSAEAVRVAELIQSMRSAAANNTRCRWSAAEEGSPTVPKAAFGSSDRSLAITADELGALVDAFEALLRPYASRSTAPAGATAVQVTIRVLPPQAFVRG